MKTKAACDKIPHTTQEAVEARLAKEEFARDRENFVSKAETHYPDIADLRNTLTAIYNATEEIEGEHQLKRVIYEPPILILQESIRRAKFLIGIEEKPTQAMLDAFTDVGFMLLVSQGT